MAGKKLVIIVMAGLGIVSFAASFVLSGLLGGSPEPAPAAETAGATPPTPGAELAAAEGVVPKAKHLEELIKELRLRIAECREKESRLEQREMRIGLAEELLKKQAKELESLRMELVAPLTQLKEAKAELERTMVVIARQEEANLKKTAAIYEKMEPAAGGAILSQMCANQQEQDVVKILHLMSERSAAKVLAEMPDKSLAARLSEKMKRIGREG